VEFRAQAAELEAREAKEALARVEEAIRRRLLCASPETASHRSSLTFQNMRAVVHAGSSCTGTEPMPVEVSNCVFESRACKMAMVAATLSRRGIRLRAKTE